MRQIRRFGNAVSIEHGKTRTEPVKADKDGPKTWVVTGHAKDREGNIVAFTERFTFPADPDASASPSDGLR